MKRHKKRIRTNRGNIVEFFSGHDKHGQPRANTLETIDPETFIKFAQTYLAHPTEFDNILAYARRFKKAAREISEDDVREAAREVAVRRVMES